MPKFSIPVLDPEFDDFECGCEQCDEYAFLRSMSDEPDVIADLVAA